MFLIRQPSASRPEKWAYWAYLGLTTLGLPWKTSFVASTWETAEEAQKVLDQVQYQIGFTAPEVLGGPHPKKCWEQAQIWEVPFGWKELRLQPAPTIPEQDPDPKPSLF